MYIAPSSEFEALMPGFSWKFTVPAEVIDAYGHVNNVAYVQWMQDVAIRHTQSVGGDVVADEAGIIWVVKSHEVEYLRQTFEGEALRVETFIEDTERELPFDDIFLLASRMKRLLLVAVPNVSALIKHLVVRGSFQRMS